MKTLTFTDLLSGQNLGFGTSITTADIVVALLVTFFISLFIYYIYKKTYSGVLYSRDFNVTLIIVSMVVAVIMMGISSNLALALGMVGALSIVRFRSAIKEPRDITFLFWSISMGIVNGVQFYKLSIIASIFIGVVLLVLSKKVNIRHPYMLVLKFSDINDAELEDALNRNCSRHTTRNRSLTDHENEMVIEVMLKKDKEKTLLKEVKAIKGVKSVNLFSYLGELSD